MPRRCCRPRLLPLGLVRVGLCGLGVCVVCVYVLCVCLPFFPYHHDHSTQSTNQPFSDIIADAELTGVGVQWSNLFQDSYSFGGCLALMFVDFWIYGLLALYFDQVNIYIPYYITLYYISLFIYYVLYSPPHHTYHLSLGSAF